MRLLSTVYFLTDIPNDEISKDDVGKIIGVKDSQGLYSVLLKKNKKIFRVHPNNITKFKPAPQVNVFQSLQSLSLSPRTRSTSARSNSSSHESGSTTDLPHGSRSMEGVRADVLRNRQEDENDVASIATEILTGARPQHPAPSPQQRLMSDTSLRTENIPLITHVHGRQRRAQRNIQRKELQAAIKYGLKEPANPGRDGSPRWRYTHNGVVFITDVTSTHEVTSWRIDSKDKEGDVVAPADVQMADSKCHAVLIVDQSGSMRNSDVPGFKSRAHAVYECLERDFVNEQLKSGVATDVVVTIISMSDFATVLVHKKTLDESLIYDLQRLSRRKAKSHGNYIPALDKALEVTKDDIENTSRLLLLFFSDGAPSDHVFKIKNRKASVDEECCQRVKSIGKIFGADKVIFRTLAFGPPNEDFSLLEKMAKVLPRGEFQKLGLNAASLKTSFSSLSSSLSTLRTEGGHRALTRRSDKVVDQNQTVDKSTNRVFGVDGWWIYAFNDFVGKYEFKDDTDSAQKLRRVALDGLANGIAFLQQPFAEGAERFVYRCTEIVCQSQLYAYPAFSANMAERCGFRLVAKEAKDLENHHQGPEFHETFARIQSDAGKLARSFTSLLPVDRPEWNLNFIKTFIYGCCDDSYEHGQAWLLVEPELDGKFTKWNNNAGEVRGQTSGRGSISGVGILEELEESEKDDDEMVPIQIDDIPQTFSHFSYEHSNGKQLVCDLQGVWNADDGFLLTDPVIHHVCSKGTKHLNGATDKGVEGVKKFFETHVCNSLCRRMKLPERTPEKLIEV